MHLGVILIVPFLCLSTQSVTQPYTSLYGVTQPDVSEESETANEALDSDLSKIEKTLSSLNVLANAQRQIWIKQLAHEEQVRKKNKEEEAREAARSRALENEQIVLRQKSRKFSQKLKLLSKNAKNGQRAPSLGDTSIFNKAKDCSDVYLEGDETTGVHRLWPTRYQDGRGFPAYCDMDTDGGGWTVIHRRIAEGFFSNYYNRSWKDYKHGFGDLESSFWLGNEQLHQLTNQGAYELRIDMESSENKTHSVYQSFFVEDETTHYKLHVAGYQSDGTEGDVMMSHDGANFSTYDQNNLPKYLHSKRVYDSSGRVHSDYRYVEEYVTPSGCAESSACGWWFNTDCELDQRLNLTVQIAKMEMKIRQRLYSQKITESNLLIR